MAATDTAPRMTGATRDQIKEACRRRHGPDAPGYWPFDEAWDVGNFAVMRARDEFTETARYLVPPDHAIVSRADLRALRDYVAELEDAMTSEFGPPTGHPIDAVIARIAAILDGEGTDGD